MKVFGLRRRKYNNIPTFVDGMRFESKAEAARYGQLQLLAKAGEIKDLRRQVRYPFVVNGLKIGTYVSDFDYTTKEGSKVVEDVKGVRTAMFRLKARLMKACWGVDVQEVYASKYC